MMSIIMTNADLLNNAGYGYFESMEKQGFKIPTYDINGEKLDETFKFMHGLKQLPMSIISLQSTFSAAEIVDKIAEICIIKNGNNWNREKELIDTEIPGSERIITETIGKTGSNENVTNDVKKVSAYNSEDFVNDEGNDTTQTGTNKDDTERTLTEKNTYGAQLDVTIKRLQNYLIYDIMFMDIKKLCCLEVY